MAANVAVFQPLLLLQMEDLKTEHRAAASEKVEAVMNEIIERPFKGVRDRCFEDPNVCQRIRALIAGSIAKALASSLHEMKNEIIAFCSQDNVKATMEAAQIFYERVRHKHLATMSYRLQKMAFNLMIRCSHISQAFKIEEAERIAQHHHGMPLPGHGLNLFVLSPHHAMNRMRMLYIMEVKVLATAGESWTEPTNLAMQVLYTDVCDRMGDAFLKNRNLSQETKTKVTEKLVQDCHATIDYAFMASMTYCEEKADAQEPVSYQDILEIHEKAWDEYDAKHAPKLLNIIRNDNLAVIISRHNLDVAEAFTATTLGVFRRGLKASAKKSAEEGVTDAGSKFAEFDSSTVDEKMYAAKVAELEQEYLSAFEKALEFGNAAVTSFTAEKSDKVELINGHHVYEKFKEAYWKFLRQGDASRSQMADKIIKDFVAAAAQTQANSG
ncbi:uncharacterized protein CTRU02_200642 [Colletotrichum truncatum]|uniref:Uncharacterized protein n=1 Tax=Colletotrichum truncatum TaxID=5467 RepID=A0ACC3ZF55_COLTU|nr:uncharacterized protein CTRU02_00405 [Colletotrichum truncatum]KAF6801656.1 hypothetical protein CTRU02_00405 [Colletotrichum truncatum]